MDDRPADRLVDLLSVAQRLLSRDLGERLADEGVTVDQWRTLRAISEQDGISMGDLAERLQMPAPSATRVVDSLVDSAFVFRRPAAEDRRRVDVHLSNRGAELLRHTEAIAELQDQAVERRIGQQKVEVLTGLLKTIVEGTSDVRSYSTPDRAESV